MLRGFSFLKALQQRVDSVDLVPPLTSEAAFDLGAARSPREVAYTEAIASLTEESISECGSCDARLLKFNQGFVKKIGVPDNTVANLDVLSPKDKKWERHMRHRTGHFVAHQQREAFYFNQRGLQQTCTPVPSWFEPYEVHYGFHPETPPILSYKGSYLAYSDSSAWWQVFLTEWIAMVAFELMYQARRGRLHYISPVLRQGIRDVGFMTIMDQDRDLADQLRALVREIQLIRWSQVSPKNRSLPDHAMRTKVTASGNWVAFDPEAWESQMEDSMYLDEERAVAGPDEPVGDLRGYIDRQAEEHRAYDQGEGAFRPPPALQADPNAKQTAHQQVRASRILNRVLLHAGVTPLLRDAGYPGDISLDDEAAVLRLHFSRHHSHTAATPRGEGPSPMARALVAPKGGDTRVIKIIREELDEMKAASGATASGATTVAPTTAKVEVKTEVKEEAVLEPTPAIFRPAQRKAAPETRLTKRKATPDTRPAKRIREASASGSRSQPSASTNKPLSPEVINLVTSSESEPESQVYGDQLAGEAS